MLGGPRDTSFGRPTRARVSLRVVLPGRATRAVRTEQPFPFTHLFFHL